MLSGLYLRRSRLLLFFYNPRVMLEYIKFSHQQSRYAISLQLLVQVFFYVIVVAHVPVFFLESHLIPFTPALTLTTFFVVLGLSAVNAVLFAIPFLNRQVVFVSLSNIFTVLLTVIFPLASLWDGAIANHWFVTTSMWSVATIILFPSGVFVLKLSGAIMAFIFFSATRYITAETFNVIEIAYILVTLLGKLPVSYFMAFATMSQFISIKKIEIQIAETEKERQLNQGLISTAIPQAMQSKLLSIFESMSTRDELKCEVQDNEGQLTEMPTNVFENISKEVQDVDICAAIGGDADEGASEERETPLMGRISKK